MFVLYCKHVELECGRRVGGGEAKILAMIAIFLCITLLHLPTNRSPMVRYPHLPLHHTDAYLDALAHFVDFILMQSHNRQDAKPFGVKTLPRCIFGCGFSSPYNYLIHEQRRKLKSKKNLYDTVWFKFVTLHVSRYKYNESLLCRTRGLIQLNTDVYKCITPVSYA